MSTITKLLIGMFILVGVMVVYNLQSWSLNPLAVGGYAVRSFANMVGISAIVPSNPFNKLAKQLQEKEMALALRESNLEANKIFILEEPIKKQNMKINILLGIGAILFFMILVNFFLDLRRNSSE